MRLSDVVRGGQDPAGPGEPTPRSRSLVDVVREGAKPAAPASEPAPPEGTVTPGGEGPEGAATSSDASELLLGKAAERIGQALAARAEAPLSIEQAKEAVDLLLQSLETSDALLVGLFRSAAANASRARAAVNVCIVALKIGLDLGYGRNELRDLGLAALFADIGTTLAPTEMLASPSPLTAQERGVLLGHQREAASLLEKLAPRYRWLGEIVRKRYERPDEPHRPQSKPEEYAAIIHLAEVYKSLVHPRASRKRLGPLDALKEILHRHRATFPDPILKALIRAMSAYPVGSLVRLNTGEVGLVVQRNKDYPLRPVIDVLVRRGKRLPEPFRVDLARRPLLHVTDSVLEEDLP